MSNFMQEQYSPEDGHPINPKIEEVLYQDEQIVEHLIPEKKAYLYSQLFYNFFSNIALLLVNILFIFIVVKAGVYITKPGSFIMLMVFFFFTLWPIGNWIYKIITTVLKLRYEEYYITNQRIIIKTGGKRTFYRGIYIDNIYNVKVKVNLIDKRLKVADILIFANQTDIIYGEQPIVKEIRQLVLFDQRYPQEIIDLIKELKENLYQINQRG